MGTSHPLSVGSNNHSILANPNATGAFYADVAERDADTAFNEDADNIGKVVGITSPLSTFILLSVGPTVFEELTNLSTGAIIGPGTTTLNTIPTWNVTDGTSQQNNEGFTWIDIGADRFLELQADTVFDAGFRLRNESGVAEMDLVFDNSQPIVELVTFINPLNIRVEVGNLQLEVDTAANSILFAGGLHADSDVLVRMSTVGFQGADLDIFVGTDNPQGSVLAEPGSQYSRINAADSRLNINTGATTGTTWQPCIVGPGDAGGVVFRSIAIWGASDGDEIISENKIVITNSGGILEFEMGAPSPGDLVQFHMHDVNDTPVFEISMDDTTKDTTISNVAGDLILTSTISGDNIIARQEVNDTLPSLTIDNIGTNPGLISIRVGNRDPVGNVTAVPGTIYASENAALSTLFMHEGTGSDNTSWAFLLKSDTAVAPIVSGSEKSIAMYADTTGQRVTPTQGVLARDDATVTEINLKPSQATADVNYHLSTSLGVDAFEINRGSDTGATTIMNNVGGLNITNSVGQITVDAQSGNLNLTSSASIFMQSDFLIGLIGADLLRIRKRTPNVDLGGIREEWQDGANVTQRQMDFNDVTNVFTDVIQLPLTTTVVTGDWTLNTTVGEVVINKFDFNNGNSPIFTLNQGLAASTSNIEFRDSGDVLAALIFHDGPSDLFLIDAKLGDLELASLAGNVNINASDGIEIKAGGTGHVEINAEVAAGSEILTIANDTATREAAIFVENDDPEGAVSADGGAIVIRDNNEQSTISLKKSTAFSSDDWFSVSVNSPLTFEIHNSAEFEALAVAGVITIAESTTIIVKASFSTSSRFDVTGGDLIMSANYSENATLTYTGTGTFFTVAASLDVRLRARIRIVSSSTGVLVDKVGPFGAFDIGDVTIQGWDDLGTVREAVFLMRQSNLVFYDAPLKLIDTDITVVDGVLAFGGRAFDISHENISFNGEQMNISSVIQVGLTAPPIRVDPFLGTDANVAAFLIGTGTELVFDITGGSTGTFTAVADVSISATAIPTVSDSGGFAQFNHAGTDVFIGQEVTISVFVTNTDYNGTFTVTATGAGTFETGVAFGTTEVGSFLADAVRFTSTAHGLSNTNTLQIDSDLSTDYEGGFKIFNALTNSFDISTAFIVTQTGGWDTAGVDQTNPKVLAFSNSTNEPSHYIATAFVNTNTTSNSPASGIFENIIFGTVGDALIAGTTIERWKLINEINGIFEYTGLEPFSGYITFDFSCESSGGAQDFLFKWEHDIGAGFVDLPDPVVAIVNIGNNAKSITKTFPLRATVGDQIRPRLTRASGSSSIITTHATIYVSQ